MMEVPPVERICRDIDAAAAAEILKQYNRILIVSHVRPDGDCLGSMLGLYHALVPMGKTVVPYNVDPIHERWDFLPGVDKIVCEFPEWTPDLTVFVDCGGPRRVKDEYQPQGVVLNIDHHLTNERFGDYNFIDVETAAVGHQIYIVLKELGVALTPKIATCLYLSMMTDTGSFRYPNTSADCLRVASSLVQAGADPGDLAQRVFETRTREEIALTAKVLSSLHYEVEGCMVWSELRREDYEANGGYEHEPEGLSSDIRGIKGVEVSCLLHENEEGDIRAGFRGKGAIDCSAIAKSLGGGGHFNASGVYMKGVPYQEGRERILSALRTAAQAWIDKQG